MSEKLFVRPAAANADCQVHDWPSDGLAKRLILEMRRAHGKGGVNICRECVERARESARPTPPSGANGKSK